MRLAWIAVLSPLSFICCAHAPADSTGPHRIGASPQSACGGECEQIAAFDGAIEALAFDGEHIAASVSLGSRQNIEVVPVAGGAVTSLFASERVLSGVALLDGFAYFIEQAAGALIEEPARLRRVAVEGGAVETLTKVTGSDGLFTAAPWVIVGDKDGFVVLSDDGTKVPMFRGGGELTVALGLDHDNLYWEFPGLFGSGGSVWASPRSGAEPRRLLRTNQIVGTALDATHAYVIEGGVDEQHQLDGAVIRTPLDGGPTETLLAVPELPKSEERVAGIALDRGFVYFPVGDAVYMLPKDGGELTHAFAPVSVTLVAEDRNHVYFVPKDDTSALLRKNKLMP